MSGAVVSDNAGWAAVKPRLSVLIPFLRDDPAALLVRLDEEAAPVAGEVEIVVLDDGTGDAELTERLVRQTAGMALPVRLVTLSANQGRAEGRNRLAAEARGEFLLFLDSDMRPDRPDFLARWVRMAREDRPALAFGGFSLDQAPTDARFSVHRAIAAHSECLDAAERSRDPAKYVFTSNLLVRRDVFASEAFDSGFSGWGWEDVEWAVRVARRHPVTHVDNPATHMGLDTVEALARKYEQAAPNFARMAERHPQVVAAYPSHRLARRLKGVPALGVIRRGLKRLAMTGWAPVRLRAFSLRLYRTALYAEVV